MQAAKLIILLRGFTCYESAYVEVFKVTGLNFAFGAIYYVAEAVT